MQSTIEGWSIACGILLVCIGGLLVWIAHVLETGGALAGPIVALLFLLGALAFSLGRRKYWVHKMERGRRGNHDGV